MNQRSLVHCPACTNSVADQNPRQVFTSAITKQRYFLHRCKKCDLWFWSPRKLNPDLYRTATLHEYTDYHQGQRPFPPWTRPFFGSAPLRSGSLLDVGCGDGAFLAEAAKMGFRVQGVDLDERSVQVAREKHGLQNIIVAPLDSFLLSTRAIGHRYDIACFFEVLEHQADPDGFLDAIGQIVAPGGYVVGSVPNRKRFLAWLDRRVGAGDLPPHHFLWFSRLALTNILGRHGFCDVHVIPSGNISFAALADKACRIVADKLGPRIRRYPSGSNWILRLALRVALTPALGILWLGLQWRPAHLYFQARRYT